MMKKGIIILVLMLFPLCCVMLELKNRKYTVEINQEFVSTETAIGTGKVVSTTACASVCTSNDKCCTANYNTSTQDCNLNSCCIPDTRPSENGITIKRVAKPDEDDVKTKRMNCGDVCKGSGDGIYIIFPDGSNEGIEVYCELDDAYGWTVIQRRVDDSEDFNRSWLDYKHGFGNLSGNFWLGNANIHKIVAGTNHSLRVDIEDKDNKTYGADYHIFNVSDERSNYTLTIVDQSGKDGKAICNNLQFSTSSDQNGWWHDASTCCDIYNLNKKYSNLIWNDGHTYEKILKFASMKIKRT